MWFSIGKQDAEFCFRQPECGFCYPLSQSYRLIVRIHPAVCTVVYEWIKLSIYMEIQSDIHSLTYLRPFTNRV